MSEPKESIVDELACPDCAGQGEVIINTVTMERQTCAMCGGTGRRVGQRPPPSHRVQPKAPDRPKLEELLRQAAEHEMTPDEILEQKVSFIYGQIVGSSPDVTKEEIRARLLEKRGHLVEASPAHNLAYKDVPLHQCTPSQLIACIDELWTERDVLIATLQRAMRGMSHGMLRLDPTQPPKPPKPKKPSI